MLQKNSFCSISKSFSSLVLVSDKEVSRGLRTLCLPWWPKQLPWTSLRMMLDFPDACMPWIIMPPLVGRSDDKCSRTSRKSHFRPTNVVLDMDGTSKNRGLSGQFSLLKAGKIKKEIRMKSWTFYWISSSRHLFFWRITVHTTQLLALVLTRPL